jgi:hypothetical protein
MSPVVAAAAAIKWLWLLLKKRGMRPQLPLAQLPLLRLPLKQRLISRLLKRRLKQHPFSGCR